MAYSQDSDDGYADGVEISRGSDPNNREYREQAWIRFDFNSGYRVEFTILSGCEFTIELQAL